MLFLFFLIYRGKGPLQIRRLVFSFAAVIPSLHPPCRYTTEEKPKEINVFTENILRFLYESRYLPIIIQASRSKSPLPTPPPPPPPPAVEFCLGVSTNAASPLCDRVSGVRRVMRNNYDDWKACVWPCQGGHNDNNSDVIIIYFVLNAVESPALTPEIPSLDIYCVYDDDI